MAKEQSTLKSSENSCKFCLIIGRKQEGYLVFEDNMTIAFLDINPLFPGHTLLVPKKHYKTIKEIPDPTISALFNNVKILSSAQEKGLGSDGTFIAVNDKVSQSIPHLHIHIVPRRLKDGLKGFFWPRHKYNSKDEMLQVQQKIVKALKAQG